MLKGLERVTSLLVDARSWRGALERVGAVLTDVLHAERWSIMLKTELDVIRISLAKGLPQQVIRETQLKLGEGIAGRVLQTGEALLLTNAPETRLGRPSHDPQSERYRNRSALSVPLSIHGQVLGVININDRRDDLTKPQLVGLEVAGRSEPCASAGGDYIDYFEGTRSQDLEVPPLFLACGDVSGHGVGAAVIMAMGRAFLRALLRQSQDLASVMYEMNNLIEADTPTGQFMTLFVGILDARAGLLRFVSAGHDPALLFRARNHEIIETCSTGLPLGMFEHQHYSVSELWLEPGDVLLLSTDGIAEATSIHGDFYGRERLKQDLRELHQLSADEIVSAIEQRVLAFTRPRAITDDLSLIVTRVLPSA
ncbi:SpoIIE family protein phosphatase [Halochromatium sp.]